LYGYKKSTTVEDNNRIACYRRSSVTNHRSTLVPDPPERDAFESPMAICA
jgi:hypothetical protein